MTSSNPQAQIHFQIIEARPEDVKRAFQDLKKDMNPEFVHVFLDKMQRYSTKPDRALFLTSHQGSCIAFATVINHAPAPKDSDDTLVQLLQKYACGTGLMVLPEYRHRGVAVKLVEQWDIWALKNNIPGIWVVTHQMSDWYQKHFNYTLQGRTMRKGVEKTSLTKTYRMGK